MALDCGLSGRPTRAVGVLHDDPTRTSKDQLRYVACLSIDADRFGDLMSVRPMERHGFRIERLVYLETLVGVHDEPAVEIGRTYVRMRNTVESARRSAPDPVAWGPPFIEVYDRIPSLVSSTAEATEIHLPLPLAEAR